MAESGLLIEALALIEAEADTRFDHARRGHRRCFFGAFDWAIHVPGVSWRTSLSMGRPAHYRRSSLDPTLACAHATRLFTENRLPLSWFAGRRDFRRWGSSDAHLDPFAALTPKPVSAEP